MIIAILNGTNEHNELVDASQRHRVHLISLETCRANFYLAFLDDGKREVTSLRWEELKANLPIAVT